jgi:hypothetical protein
MTKLTNTLLSVALGSLLAGSAVAQTSSTSTTSGAGPGVYDPGHPRVNQVNRREQNQQNRIANGVKSGQLTPGEAARLEKKENHIVKQEQRDMAKNNGHLTKAEQAKLNRDQNRVSKQIYRDKHNDKVQ